MVDDDHSYDVDVVKPLGKRTKRKGSPRRRWLVTLPGKAFRLALLLIALWRKYWPRRPAGRAACWTVIVIVLLALLYHATPEWHAGWPVTPQQWLHMNDFVVLSINGTVTGNSKAALKVGSYLRPPFTLATGSDGRIGIITRRGAYLYLGPNTEMMMTARGVSRVTHGRLHYNDRCEVERVTTPAGDIRFANAITDVDVPGKETVAVTVIDGEVKLSNTHGSTAVVTGQRGELMANAAPDVGHPVNLIAATAWYDGRDETVPSSLASPLTVSAKPSCYDGSKQWMSDSGKIAYTVVRDAFKSPYDREQNRVATEIWTMNADGTHKQRIRTYYRFVRPITWIPHHDILQVAHDYNDPCILLNVDTGQETPLQGGGSIISPNGRLFTSYSPAHPNAQFSDGNGLLSVYDILTGESRPLGNMKDLGTPICWSPDGRYLAATWEPPDAWEKQHRDFTRIRLIDVASGNSTDTGIEGVGPVFSPDGTRIAYMAQSTERCVRSGGPEEAGIFVADLRSGKRWAVTKLVSGALGPRWSPDGTKILFWRRHEGARPTDPPVISLHIAEADGSGEREISREKRLGSPWWTPTGDAIFARMGEWKKESVQKVASTGAGIIARLGGSLQDSRISFATAWQIARASSQSAMAERLYFEEYGLFHDGHFARARRKCYAAANTIAAVPWSNPLAGFDADSVLRNARQYEAPAERTDAQILEEQCWKNMEQARLYIAKYVCTYGKLPDSIERARDSTPEVMKKPGYIGCRLCQHDAEYAEVFYCPGKDRRHPVLYRLDAKSKGWRTLKVDDILISCPNHPKNKLTVGDLIRSRVRVP